MGRKGGERGGGEEAPHGSHEVGGCFRGLLRNVDRNPLHNTLKAVLGRGGLGGWGG